LEHLRGYRGEHLGGHGERSASTIAKHDLRGVHLIEGAGHWVQQEEADEVNRLLIAFLDSL
jgi:pimeloyl-ACP methyl ester carboxylesterase